MAESDPLLTTKLGVQGRGVHHVRRQRLRDLLDDATSARLVLLSAPAGFGKSSLLADWLTSSARPFGWVSLDSADNDPPRFLGYLREAAAHIRGSEGARGGTDAHRPPGADLVLADLVEALSTRPDPAVLVLDDYHVIVEPAVHAIVSRLIDRLPPNARLAIATRADPPLPLARLRANGELVEIRADALRFSRDEAAAFLTGPMALELTPDEVDQLAHRTEGWVAALQLAALSLRGGADTARFVREFGASNRFLLDFVVEEVLASLPAETQEFLLGTSILERLTGPLCDAVTGGAEGTQMLDRLERANMLLFPLDQGRHWYRYHQLFADLLQARLAMHDPQRPGRLHSRAAAWYEAQAMFEQAIGHALRGADVARARRLVRGQWMAVLHAGRLWTVQRWLDSLPVDVVRADPQLSAAYAWGLVLRGEAEGVAGRLEDARRALAEGQDSEPVDRALVPPQLELLEAKLAELLGDPDAEIAHAQAAIACIPSEAGPHFEALLRGDAMNLLGQAYLLKGDDVAAARALREALPLLRRTGNSIGVTHGVRDLVRIELRAGRPDAALELSATSLGEAQGVDEPAAAAALHVARAEALLTLGRPEAARESALRAEALAADSGDGGVLRDARAILEKVNLDHPSVAGTTAEQSPARVTIQGLVEPLTPREFEVLRLVAAGHSNRQIAAELFVTLGTAKAHVHSICGKLGAASRVQAIVRGRELGLLT